MPKKATRKREASSNKPLDSTPNEVENLKPLSNSAVIVLGLLAEEPSHPYDLNKKLDGRGYRNWTSIGFSSIYSILRALEKDGLVEMHEVTVDSRTRTIYDLTSFGRKMLTAEVVRILAHPTRPVAEWDLGLAYMYRLLSYDQQIQNLEQYRALIVEGMKFLEQRTAEFPTDDLDLYRHTYHIRALFEHPIYLNRGELAFIDDLISKIKQIKEYDAKNSNSKEKRE
jgi:DNA-binding PadR family transcriptional regulator